MANLAINIFVAIFLLWKIIKMIMEEIKIIRQAVCLLATVHQLIGVAGLPPGGSPAPAAWQARGDWLRPPTLSMICQLPPTRVLLSECVFTPEIHHGS